MTEAGTNPPAEPGGADRKRILFVDDEEQVLSGLRLSLRRLRKEWDMAFVSSGAAAIEHMDDNPVDVVISDMRMPHMDGSTLLTWVKENRPEAVRIVLSGQTEIEAALKSVTVAHQFLTKPCEAQVLRETVRRIGDLRARLADDDLQKLASGVGRLPPAPATFTKVTRAMGDPNTSLQKLAEILSEDVALTAKILQVVNSAFFGLPQKISDVRQAVTYLGLTTVRNILLSVEAFSALGKSAAPGGKIDLDAVQQRSLQVAQVAKAMMKDKAGAEHAFAGGMLHAVGWLLLDEPESLDRDKVDLMSAYLLGIWSLPHPVMEAVAFHRRPWDLEHEGFREADAVYTAWHLTAALDESAGPNAAPWQRTEGELDTAYLHDRGVDDATLARWRDRAEKVVSRQG